MVHPTGPLRTEEPEIPGGMVRFILQYPEASGSAHRPARRGRDRRRRGGGRSGRMGRHRPHGAPRAEQHAGSNPAAIRASIPSSRSSSAAGVTTKLALVTNLSVIPYRNPLLLAKSAATLNRMSEGRFYMGAGAGYLKSEYFALGVDFKERNALFEEALQVMRLHWSGEPFDFEGRHFSARNIRALPAPRHNRVPIWMGGNSDAALQASRDLRRRMDADDGSRVGGQDGAHAARHDTRGARRNASMPSSDSPATATRSSR